MHEVTVTYTEELARQAVRAFFWRTLRSRFGWLGLLALLLVTTALAGALWLGDRSWFVGFLAACLLSAILIFAVGYSAHMRNTLGRFRQMTSRQANFVFRDADFTITSQLGSATLQWSAVSEVWAFPAFWLLLLSKAHFVTLPLQGVSESALAFVRARVHMS